MDLEIHELRLRKHMIKSHKYTTKRIPQILICDPRHVAKLLTESYEVPSPTLVIRRCQAGIIEDLDSDKIKQIVVQFMLRPQ